MRGLSSIVCLWSCVSVLGCGAASYGLETSTPTIRERQLFADSLRVAFVAYERDVLEARTIACQSEAEASALSEAHRIQRFQGYLSAALYRRGLEAEDMDQFLSQNPSFAHEQRLLYGTRLVTLDEHARHILAAFHVERESEPVVGSDPLVVAMQ